MNTLRVFSLLLGLACLPGAVAWAQVYKCVQPSGAVAYADAPCGRGERGGPIAVEPSVVDASEGRERDQNALNALEKRKQQSLAEPNAAEADSGAAPVATNRVDRQSRWDRCEPLLEQSSGTRQQGIGALCGADIDDALFETCVAKVQDAGGSGEIEAVVRACTGAGLGGGTVVTRPYRGRPFPTGCPPHSKDPACVKPPERRPPKEEKPLVNKPPDTHKKPSGSIRAIVPDEPDRP